MTTLPLGEPGLVNVAIPDLRRLTSLKSFECDFCPYSQVPEFFDGPLVQSLESLRLAGMNARSSSFPQSLGNAVNLVNLFMADTTGPLPDLSRLTRLTSCALGNFGTNCIDFIDPSDFIFAQPAACRASFRRFRVCPGATRRYKSREADECQLATSLFFTPTTAPCGHCLHAVAGVHHQQVLSNAKWAISRMFFQGWRNVSSISPGLPS
ncbi:hypothetical protein BC829DRAFT_3948 [Chytridium lagenaria]|nr:hypothetical protein BC829DRAFT_3948 [Chytridium lagenaria]